MQKNSYSHASGCIFFPASDGRANRTLSLSYPKGAAYESTSRVECGADFKYVPLRGIGCTIKQWSHSHTGMLPEGYSRNTLCIGFLIKNDNTAIRISRPTGAAVE